MNTKSLTNILGKVTNILSHYPDKSIVYVLNDINKMLDEKKEKAMMSEKSESNNTISSSYDNDKINKFFKSIDSLSIEEINSSLSNHNLFNNVASLRYFSSLLEITISKNQSRQNMIRTIIKSIERSQIDKTIGMRNEKYNK